MKLHYYQSLMDRKVYSNHLKVCQNGKVKVCGIEKVELTARGFIRSSFSFYMST